MAIVAAGQPAPDFTLKTADGEDFTREQLLGRTTVLVFYPFAFSPVCTDQLSLYNEVLEDFAARGATLYGVSCDATYSQTRVQGAARDRDRAALGLRAQGRGLPGVRRLSPGRLPAARAGGHRPRRHRALEPPGRHPGRAARRQPDLRRAVLSDLGSAPLPPVGPADHVRGDGRLVVVYGDYECPYCAAFELQLRELRGARVLPPLPGEAPRTRARTPRPARPRPPRCRARSGRCTTRCSPTRAGSRTRTCGRARSGSGSTSRASTPTAARTRWSRRSRRSSARACAPGVVTTPTRVPGRRAATRPHGPGGAMRLEVVALDHQEVALSARR